MPQETDMGGNNRKKMLGRIPFSRKRLGKSVHSMLDGTFLTRDRFRRALPFIVLLMIMGVLYISNIFHVERTKRQIDDLEEELRELRYEYISSRSKLMYESKPSEIAIKLKDTGIRETLDPPKKIIINNETGNK